MRLHAPALLVALLCAAGCRPAAPPTPPDPPTRLDVPTPAAPGARTPQLAAADGHVLMSWIEPAADSPRVALRFAAFDGTAWAPPQTAAEGADWVVNAADMAGVTPLPGGALIAHYLVRGPGAGYSLRVTRSDDGGATWTAPVTPHRDGTPTEHGFARVLPWAGGRAGLVWLDGRKYAAPAADPRVPQETALRFATLGPDGTLSDEAELDPRTCDCCSTAAAFTADGVIAAYRDRSADEVRDVAVVRAHGGRWTAPQPVHPDGWRIDGCPVNGPALAAEGQNVALVWFTGANDVPHVRAAFSTDAGATFGAPVEVAEAVPLGRVGVVLAGPGRAVVSWMEGPASGATLRLRRVSAGGTSEAPITVAENLDARRTGFPALARQDDAVVLAWTAPAPDGRPRVQTARWAFAPTP